MLKAESNAQIHAWNRPPCRGVRPARARARTPREARPIPLHGYRTAMFTLSFGREISEPSEVHFVGSKGLLFVLFCFNFSAYFFFSDRVSHPMQSVFLPPLPEVCECLASAVFIVCVRRTARCPVRIFQLLFHPHGPPTTPFRSLHQCPTATPTLTCSRKENHRMCVCVCVRVCVCESPFVCVRERERWLICSKRESTDHIRLS